MSNLIEIKVDYRNYKKLGTGELEAEGNLIIIEGDNRIGKSSLINGILENLNAKAISEEPLKRGTSSGFKQIRVPDKNGVPITINHTFGTKEKPKFYATRDDGQNIKSVTQIREIIGDVCPYTIEDVFRKNESVSGRREIVKNIFLPLLSLENQKRIEEINNKINTTNGSVYIERRDKAKELEIAKGSKVSNEENVENYLKDHEGISREKFDEHIKSISEKINTLEKNISEKTVEKNNVSTNIRMLSKWKEHAEEYNKFKEEFPREKYPDVLNNWFKVSEGASKYFSTAILSLQEKDYDTEINSLQEELTTKRHNLSTAQIIQSNITTLANIDSNIKTLEKELNKIEENLESLKTEKAEIFSNSELPNGLEILSDSEYTFNGFNINSAELSESEAWLLLLKLMMPIYEGKILFAGNIGIYGKKALKEVSELAEKYGKMCLVERVNDERDNVAMVAYLDDENTKPPVSSKSEEKEIEPEPEEKQDYSKTFKEKVEKTKKGEDPFIPNKEAKKEPKEDNPHKDIDVNKDIEVKGDIFSGEDASSEQSASDEKLNYDDKDLFDDVDNSASLF